MGDQLSGFRSPEDASRYLERYDRFVADHWPEPHEELDVATSFGPTHVRRTGPADAPALMLIHPTSGASLGLHPLVGPLATRHAVYTPDTIGAIGRSVQTAPIRHATDLSAWLDDVLDELGLDHVHLAGYSEGGWIAGVHAAHTRRRDRLASVTLIEPGGAIERIPRRTLAAMMVRGAAVLARRDKARAIRSFSHWLSGDIELSDDEVELVLLAFKTFRQKLPIPGRLSDEELRAVTNPTLLLLAAESRIYDVERVAARARELLPAVTVEITPGTGHGLPLERPGQVTKRMLEFTATHETVTGS
jgi:pimeloyl-ACP methyl ester carboxylesterase